MKKINNILNYYLFLPKEVSIYEINYVKKINKLALSFFYCHIPLLMGIAFLNNTNPLLALLLTSLVLIGPIVAYRNIEDQRSVSMVCGVTTAFLGGLLVHFGQGPMQIEMHFYFFSMIPILSLYANPMVIIITAVVVAIHHIGFWFFIPQSIFNYHASFYVVIVHAAFVVFESACSIYISRQFYSYIIESQISMEAKTNELSSEVSQNEIYRKNMEQKSLNMIKISENFATNIKNIVQNVTDSSRKLFLISEEMGDVFKGLIEKSLKISDSSQKAYKEVDYIAVSLNEIATSIGETAQQVSMASESSSKAVVRVKDANLSSKMLTEAIFKVSDITKLISKIASQINLLSLNATIEAARAGELGKGFAVVASEVKALATQTEKATENISQNTTNINIVSSKVLEAMEKVGIFITESNTYSQSIAVSVSNQSDTTNKISKSMQTTAHNVKSVIESIDAINVTTTSTEASVKDVMLAAKNLAEQSSSMDKLLNIFLKEISEN